MSMRLSPLASAAAAPPPLFRCCWPLPDIFIIVLKKMRNLARNGPLKFHCTREDESRASKREFDRERAQFAMALKI